MGTPYSPSLRPSPFTSLSSHPPPCLRKCNKPTLADSVGKSLSLIVIIIMGLSRDELAMTSRQDLRGSDQLTPRQNSQKFNRIFKKILGN